MRTFTFEWPNQTGADWQREFENVANTLKNCFTDVSQNARATAVRKLSPQFDLSHDDVNVYMEVDLAGINKEDIQITAGAENTVKITGKRETASGRTYVRRERWNGTFERTLHLPQGMEVDVDKATASYQNGVLFITIPKIVPVQESQRTITIS